MSLSTDPADLAAIIAESEELAGAAADEETADEPLRDIDLSALQARRTGVHAKQQYYLTSVVSHSGLTPFSGTSINDLRFILSFFGKNIIAFLVSGHYVTDAFDATESRWFRYNDSLVDPTSREKVLRSEVCDHRTNLPLSRIALILIGLRTILANFQWSLLCAFQHPFSIQAAQRDAYIYFLIHEKYAPVQLRT
jgi:hypothetical protein